MSYCRPRKLLIRADSCLGKGKGGKCPGERMSRHPDTYTYITSKAISRICRIWKSDLSIYNILATQLVIANAVKTCRVTLFANSCFQQVLQNLLCCTGHNRIPGTLHNAIELLNLSSSSSF